MESPNAGEGFRDLMKDEMEKEMDKLENVIADLEGRLQRSTHAVPTPRNTFVWESYRKFDSLVIDSSEELEAQLSLARANLSRLKEKIQGSKSNLKSCRQIITEEDSMPPIIIVVVVHRHKKELLSLRYLHSSMISSINHP
jgi:hypothetical protein